MKYRCSLSSPHWSLRTHSTSAALAQPRTGFQDSFGPCPRGRCALVSASWYKSGGSCFPSLAWTGLGLVSCVQNAPWNLSLRWFQCPWPASVMKPWGPFVVARQVLSIGFPFQRSGALKDQSFPGWDSKFHTLCLLHPLSQPFTEDSRGPTVAECGTRELYSPKYLFQRTVYFTVSTDISAHLNQKHPHRHTQK